MGGSAWCARGQSGSDTGSTTGGRFGAAGIRTILGMAGRPRSGRVTGSCILARMGGAEFAKPIVWSKLLGDPGSRQVSLSRIVTRSPKRLTMVDVSGIQESTRPRRNGKVPAHEPRATRTLPGGRVFGGAGALRLSDACARKPARSNEPQPSILALLAWMGSTWRARRGLLPGDRVGERLLESSSGANSIAGVSCPISR